MASGGLHPELLRIRQEYEELYEAVTSGHVSEDEASELLRNITAVDGDGAVWSFDPHTGNLMRAVPGLPSQQASPEMFAASRSGPRGQDAAYSEPPMPSLSDEGFSGSPGGTGGGGSGWDPDLDDRPTRTLSSSRRTGSRGGGAGSLRSRIDPRIVRPVAVVVVAVALSAFFLVGGRGERSGSPAPDPSPAPSVPAPDPSPAPSVPAPDPSLPQSPTVLSPLPQVLAGPDGEVVRLDRAAVERLFAGVLDGEVEVFSSSEDRWTRVYALPLLGAPGAGWRISVSEWVIAPDGRDRLTLVLTHPSFPAELSWWAFVEPEDGFWMFSELRPLPAR